MSDQISSVNAAASDSGWFGHPRQLARLFTTEMWERFGYYGMRAMLLLYLTKYFMFSDTVGSGLYGAFTSLVYLTPLIGGFLADRYLGHKRSVKFGAILMAIGYILLCFGGGEAKPYLNWNQQRYDITLESKDYVTTAEDGTEKTETKTLRYVQLDGTKYLMTSMKDSSLLLTTGLSPSASDRVLPAGSFSSDGYRNSFYVALMLFALTSVIIGNGFFKPNISTMVGALYEQGDKRRDGGFTIFYMGINLGSFLSTLLCPIFRDQFGFWAGFGLAALGMIFAWLLIQFDGGRLKGIGEPPEERWTKSAVVMVCAILALPLVWFLLNNTMNNAESIARKSEENQVGIAVVGKKDGKTLIAQKLENPPPFPLNFAIEGNGFQILSLSDNPDGTQNLAVSGNMDLPTLPNPKISIASFGDPMVPEEVALISRDSDTTLRIAKFTSDFSLARYVVFQGKRYTVQSIAPASNSEEQVVTLAEPFAAVVPLQLTAQSPISLVKFLADLPLLGKILFMFSLVAVIGIPTWAFLVGTREEAQKMTVAIILVVFSVVFWTLFEQAGSSLTLYADRNTDLTYWGDSKMTADQTQFFNPLYIVIFAPLFSIMWLGLAKRNLEPSIPVKFALGLALVGFGFLALVYGGEFADSGFKVGLFWLALAYFLHSIGELCISPVGLSMITKLSIARVVGLMMGVWFLSSAMAQYVAGIIAQTASVSTVGGEVTDLGKSLETYLGVFQQIGLWSIGFAVLLLIMSPFLKKWMHGVQ